MMQQVLSQRVTARAVRSIRLADRSINLFAALWRRFANLGASYRPEQHYMRGPGPKWHARNSH
jgi:hypothetical protein